MSTNACQVTVPLSPQDEFIEHVRPLRPALEAYCRRAIWNPNDLEDVLQSSLFQLPHHIQWADFESGSNFKAWIFKFISHECLNANRRRRKYVPTEGIEDLEVGIFAASDGSGEAYEALLSEPSRVLDQCGDRLYQALQKLSEIERSVFLLRALADFSYKEISEVLNLPMGSVMGYLFRARNHLRQDLCAEITSPLRKPQKGVKP